MSETLLTCPTCLIPNFTPKGLKAHRCKGGTRMNHTTGLVEVIPPPNKSPLVQKAAALREAKLPIEKLADKVAAERAQLTEIVTDAEVSTAELTGLAAAIEQSIDLVTSHEGAFEEATLEHRLEIGLHIAKAQEIFTLSTVDRTAPAREAKALMSTVDNRDSEVVSTVDTTSTPPAIPQGFVTWLGKNVPRLKRPTAYRYAAAFRALGIPAAEASPVRIRAKLKDLRHFAGKSNLPMPTLAALVKQAPKPPKPTLMNLVPVTMSPEQLALEDAREAFHLWREAFEKLLRQGSLDDLDKPGLLELKEFAATVRERVNARLK